jgi:diacylglycerol kinase (ATP)
MHRLLKAFDNSRRAVARAYATERAVRQELMALAFALPLAFGLTDDPWRRAALIGAVLFVLAVELLNTAIEKLCDRLHAERHDAIGYVKDCGSAAVLMSLVLAALLWGLSLWQWLERTL